MIRKNDMDVAKVMPTKHTLRQPLSGNARLVTGRLETISN